MKRLQKSHIGKIVGVKFYDHALIEGHGDLVLCLAYGELLSIEKKQIVIRHWECLDKGQSENDETVVIFKKAIVDVSVFREV